MQAVHFRFYGDLNTFLSARPDQDRVTWPLSGAVSVKHAIEALGVPHTEVALILANGRSVGFDYRLQPGDRLSVYPPFLTLQIDDLQRLRPPLPQPPAFLLDNHLGQLARHLRLLGFDAEYARASSDEELADQARLQERVLLTRDRRLLMRRQIVHGYCLRTRDPRRQLADVLRRFRLRAHIRPWSRCLRCNGQLRPVDKAAVWDRLEPLTKIYYETFRQCQSCGQVYWKGSHFEPLRALVESVRRADD
jgi:uncharacterized protein